jgi:hypothetical protein
MIELYTTNTDKRESSNTTVQIALSPFMYLNRFMRKKPLSLILSIKGRGLVVGKKFILTINFHL